LGSREKEKADYAFAKVKHVHPGNDNNDDPDNLKKNPCAALGSQVFFRKGDPAGETHDGACFPDDEEPKHGKDEANDVFHKRIVYQKRKTPARAFFGAPKGGEV